MHRALYVSVASMGKVAGQTKMNTKMQALFLILLFLPSMTATNDKQSLLQKINNYALSLFFMANKSKNYNAKKSVESQIAEPNTAQALNAKIWPANANLAQEVNDENTDDVTRARKKFDSVSESLKEADKKVAKVQKEALAYTQGNAPQKFVRAYVSKKMTSALNEQTDAATKYEEAGSELRQAAKEYLSKAKKQSDARSASAKKHILPVELEAIQEQNKETLAAIEKREAAQNIPVINNVQALKSKSKFAQEQQAREQSLLATEQSKQKESARKKETINSLGDADARAIIGKKIESVMKKSIYKNIPLNTDHTQSILAGIRSGKYKNVDEAISEDLIKPLNEKQAVKVKMKKTAGKDKK